MICRQCGKVLDESDQFCSNCGYSREKSLQEQQKVNETNKVKEIHKSNVIYINKAKNYEILKTQKGAFTFLIVLILGISGLLYFLMINQDTVYIEDASYSDIKQPEGVSYQNQLESINIANENDAKKHIIKDSDEEKTNCTTSEEVKTIENNIASNGGITSVILCNMNVEAAKSIEVAITNIMGMYPGLKGVLTNLVFTNQQVDFVSKYIPAFQFINSLSDINIYPWVIKNQIVINGNLYDDNHITSFASELKKGAETGYYVTNSSYESPLIYEFGHVLAFEALKRSVNYKNTLIVNASDQVTFTKLINSEINKSFYKNLVNEAYSNYSVAHPGVVFSAKDFYTKISNSAYNTDSNGEIKYENVIASAFVDLVTNGLQASPASIAVMNTVNGRLS